MKCDACDNEATVFLTQIINGQMTTVNLCEASSQAKSVTDDLGFGLADAFLSHGAGKTAPLPLPAESCPSCGFTAAQLKKIGRMGCPDCYDAFRPGLEGMLSSMHKGTRHIGKRPTRLVRESASRVNLSELRLALEEAVAEERYEDAARLKREIEQIEAPSAKPA